MVGCCMKIGFVTVCYMNAWMQFRHVNNVVIDSAGLFPIRTQSSFYVFARPSSKTIFCFFCIFVFFLFLIFHFALMHIYYIINIILCFFLNVKRETDCVFVRPLTALALVRQVVVL